MGMLMTKNKIIIYTSLLIIVSVVLITSGIKVSKIHDNRLLEVTTNKIVDTAKKCYYNNSCIDDKITLNELYEKMG